MSLLYKEYIKFLKENANSERAEKGKAYLYSNLEHYGVDTWTGREFFKKHKKEILDLSKEKALEVTKFYWEKPSFEERSFGLKILKAHKKELTTNDMPLIEKMMRESEGWAFLDSLIIPIMPVILDKNPKAYSYLKKWIKDDDFWVRRSALLAQIMFFRENRGNKKLFYDLAVSQFDESWIDEKYAKYKSDPKHYLHPKRAKFFIRKAIGWATREISHKDPKGAYKFLKKYKDQMSGLSFRDGSRKLPDEYKNKL
ncbi:DNA alkylation repair protein [Patescibacteria group bacterium]